MKVSRAAHHWSERSGERLSAQDLVPESPFCASRLMVGANNRAVDHLDTVRHGFAIVQDLKDRLPKPCERPTSELAID